MTSKYLEYYINLVGKAVTGFERTDSNFKRSSTMDKMLSNSFAGYRDIIRKRTSQWMRQTSLLSFFKKLPKPPKPSATTTWSVSSHQHWGKILYQLRWLLEFFSNKVFLFIYFLIFKNWYIVNLQCCVCCQVIQLYIYTYKYIYIYTFFFRFFSLIGYYKILSIVPCAIQ